MKIGKPVENTPLPVGSVGSSATGSAPSISGASTPAGAIPTNADPSAKIELSNTASTLLSSSVSPEFDAKKVAQVSSAISSGQYKINPEVIADKLISNAKELLSKAQP